VLIAQVIFLLECRQTTDTHTHKLTDATDHHILCISYHRHGI